MRWSFLRCFHRARGNQVKLLQNFVLLALWDILEIGEINLGQICLQCNVTLTEEFNFASCNQLCPSNKYPFRGQLLHFFRLIYPKYRSFSSTHFFQRFLGKVFSHYTNSNSFQYYFVPQKVANLTFIPRKITFFSFFLKWKNDFCISVQMVYFCK